MDSGVAEFLIDEQVKMIKGEIKEFQSVNMRARDEVWEMVQAMILNGTDTLDSKSIANGTLTEKVDSILLDVANGDLSPEDARKLIGLLQAGFDLTELPKLVNQLEGLDE